MIATVIRSCFPIAAQAVADKAEDINKLNVFPVPDGDTGTNMSLTLETVVREVQELPPAATIEDVAQAITHGSLMGARGNSGVITSQILRGMAEGFTTAHDPLTTADIAIAFRTSAKVAFKAVRKPVEGTILTVIHDLSVCADHCEARHMSVPETLDALVVEAYESVGRTPDLLPVLKENGVVDSGAYGFATFVEAFINAAQGHEGELTDFDPTVVKDLSAAHDAADSRVAIELNDDWEGSEFRYCNEFLFKAEKPFDPNEALTHLATLGDCELVVGSYPDYKVHVHSNEPNQVLAYMLQFGQIYEVFIHNMDMESQDRTAKIAADQATGSAETPKKPLGFVAVAAGSGEEDILKSLGVDVVVLGGQTMNPSTANILDAVAQAHAQQVIVLPNNGNIRMAADAAASASTDVQVAVVPTKTVLQAFAALFVVDLDASLEENVAAMTEALSDVRDGEVTHAVRDSQAANGDPIHAGDFMGIEGDAITVVGSDVEGVTLDLIHRMQEQSEGDTLTILAGKDLNDTQFSALCDKIEQANPDLEVDAHRGEQPLYPVIFSIE